MSRFSIVQIPGKSNLHIPVIDKTPPKDDGANTGVTSPEWMVQMDTFLTSSVEGYESYCELFGWYGESSRYTSGSLASSLYTSATLRHTDLVIIIPNGGYSTMIEGLMNTGNFIKKLVIVRLGNVKTAKVILQKLTYTNCRIQKFNQQLDQLVVELSIMTKNNTVYVYGQDGQSQGQMVTQADYSKNTAS